MIDLNERQKRIFGDLEKNGSLSVRDAQERFEIPIATLYRDFHQLVLAGMAQKVRGGIRLPLWGPQVGKEDRCAHCGGMTSARLAFNIQLINGKRLLACCAHCGLLLLSLPHEAAFALAADFLTGNMVNVSQATFLVESQVQPCCSPSVLCFACREDALRFQMGFGGRLYTCCDAEVEVAHLMTPEAPPESPSDLPR